MNARCSKPVLFPGNSFNPPRPIWTAIGRGLIGRCPSCGKGAIFAANLRRHENYPHCGEALTHADPNALSALISVPPSFAAALLLSLGLDRLFAPPVWAQIVVGEALAVYLALRILPCVHGAALGLAWAVWLGGFDPGASRTLRLMTNAEELLTRPKGRPDAGMRVTRVERPAFEGGRV